MSRFIPDPVIKRLPMYYRYLAAMEHEHKMFVSSVELGRIMGLTASQVRQDVNAFGGEGRQGTGYPVTELKKHIERLLGLHQSRRMIIIGMGHLGHALLQYRAFARSGFVTTAVFDNNPQKIGRCIGSLTVQSMDELENYILNHYVDIAVLTLPASDAQATAQRLYDCGIRGFWNFAPLDIQLPKDAAVVSAHLDESLELLSYRLRNRNG